MTMRTKVAYPIGAKLLDTICGEVWEIVGHVKPKDTGVRVWRAQDRAGKRAWFTKRELDLMSRPTSSGEVFKQEGLI